MGEGRRAMGLLNRTLYPSATTLCHNNPLPQTLCPHPLHPAPSSSSDFPRQRTLHRSAQFQRRDGGEAALNRKRGAVAKRVEIRGAVAKCAPDERLIGVFRIDGRTNGLREAEEHQRVGGRHDSMRAIAKKEVAILALRRVDRARYDREIAIQL